MANVFLSYDHDDLAPATALAKALEQAGHTVWYDRHIHGGAQYSRKIEQALDAADAVLVLWSERSLDSPWVRDEAAEGRDRGKLIPLSLGGVTPPMGFRQFQTLALGSWKGRGKVPKLDQLIEAIDQQATPGLSEMPAAHRPASHGPAEPTRPISRLLIPVAAIVLLLLAGWAGWRWIGGSGLPVVEVAAAESSPRSQRLANDLYVKLGSLAQVGEGKWQLVDAESAPDKPTYVFRAGDLGSAQQPRSNLVLSDGKDGSLLWSREFTAAAGGEADLRQQLSLTAGRVLGCALESREAGGLPRDLLKLFLNACAAGAETSMNEPNKIIDPLRSVVAARPEFKPAWSRLLAAGTSLIDVTSYSQSADSQAAVRQLRADIAAVRKIDAELPELALAELYLLPPRAFGQRLDLLEAAAERAPNHPSIHSVRADALMSVGRMNEAVEAAQRAAELDPLSPAEMTRYLMALAYAGRVGNAREQLAKAEKLWAGTAALRDAQWAFHLRYGDPRKAAEFANFEGTGLLLYLKARRDPSAANIAAAIDHLRQDRVDQPGFSTFAIQAFGEFGAAELAFSRLFATPPDVVADDAYVLFRPGLASLRRDPRFMVLAKRIGLTDFWRSSDRWPDFCDDPQLPYDCKAEAAKLG